MVAVLFSIFPPLPTQLLAPFDLKTGFVHGVLENGPIGA
jgi:hypothetical protein